MGESLGQLLGVLRGWGVPMGGGFVLWRVCEGVLMGVLVGGACGECRMSVCGVPVGSVCGVCMLGVLCSSQ